MGIEAFRTHPNTMETIMLRMISTITSTRESHIMKIQRQGKKHNRFALKFMGVAFKLFIKYFKFIALFVKKL